MTVQPQLTQLENAGLIQVAAVESELAYLFRHGLIQNAAYSTLLHGQRRLWHAATAQVLETACRSEAEVMAAAPILARHWSLAGDRPRALHYLTLAGDAAFARYANAEAAAFYQQALENANPAGAEIDPKLTQHLFARHGRALELSSRFEAALDNYRAMEAVGQTRGDSALELAAVMARATIHSTANMAQDLPQAVALLERASSLAHDLGDPVAEARINWTLLLNNSMAGGDVAQGIRYGQRALQLARAHNERELTALVLTDIWFALLGAGRWDEARSSIQEGYVLAQQLGNLPIAAECIGRLSLTDMATGRYDDCLAETAEAMRLAEALNSADARALTRSWVGVIHTDRGDVDSAIALSEEAIRFAEQSSNVTVLIGTRAELARTYGLLGDLDRGLALAEQGMAHGVKFQIIAPWAGATAAHLLLMRGDQDGAQALVARLPNYRELMQRVGFVPTMWGNLGLLEIRLAAARGDFTEALARAHELIEHFERTGLFYLRPEARLLQGQADLKLGQLDDALTALQQARAEAEAMGSRRLLWPIFSTLADIAAARGQTGARDLRQQARQMVDYIAAHAPTPALRQSFLARADVRPLLTAEA